MTGIESLCAMPMLGLEIRSQMMAPQPRAQYKDTMEVI